MSEDDTTRLLLQRPFYTGPGHEKKETFEIAMRCFVGGVSHSMNEGANNAVTKEAEMPCSILSMKVLCHIAGAQ
jgi:hypothetical protein